MENKHIYENHSIHIQISFIHSIQTHHMEWDWEKKYYANVIIISQNRKYKLHELEFQNYDSIKSDYNNFSVTILLLLHGDSTIKVSYFW